LKILQLLDPHQRRNLSTLFIAGLVFWSSLASMLPTLPLYVKDVLGGTSQQVGIVMGSFAIGLLCSRTWLGRLADQRGRKIVLLIGTAVSTIAPLSYLVVGGLSGKLMPWFPFEAVGEPFSQWVYPIPFMIVLRAFHGISIAAFATAYIALVTDLAPPKQRGEFLGYMSLVNPLGLAIGPAIAGMLLETRGYEALFLLAVALGGAGWLSILWIQPVPVLSATATLPQTPKATESNETPVRAKRHEGSNDPSYSSVALDKEQLEPERDRLLQKHVRMPYWILLGSPSIGIPALILFSAGLVFGTVATFLPLFVKEIELATNAGLFYTAAAIAGFSTRVVVGQAADRYGRGRLITLSLMFYSASMVALWAVDSTFDLLLAGLIEGIGFGILIPTVSALIADRCRPWERGRTFGLCLLGFDLGLAVAGPILGTIAQPGNHRSLFGIAAGLAFLATLTFITQSSKDLRHSIRFALGGGRDVYAIKDLG